MARLRSIDSARISGGCRPSAGFWRADFGASTARELRRDALPAPSALMQKQRLDALEELATATLKGEIASVVSLGERTMK